MRTRPLLAALSVLVALALAGCAPGAPDGDASSGTAGTQSVTDACATVGTTVADAVDRLGGVDVADPAAAVGSLTEIAERLGAASDAVHNAAVGAVLPDLRDGFESASEALQSIAAGDLTRLPALQQATADVQSAFARFSALCDAP